MKLQLDITVIFAQRLWQALSGLVTVLLLTHFLTPIQQGWYYSFLSIAALYTLFDLGLSVVLVQLSAHLFINMKWLDKGHVLGESRGRFLSLVEQSSRLYLLLGLIFCFLMIPAGLGFFGFKSADSLTLNFDWQWQWVMLVVATSLNLLALPFLAIVEGSGLVSEVYTVRLIQGVFGAFACWVMLSLGGGLWATSMIPLFGFCVVILWLVFRQSGLLQFAWRSSRFHIKWSHEIWPLQWRVGLGWLSAYFLMQIYTPILFYCQGATVAGQMGLSLTVVNMLGLLAQSWIAHRVPSMSQAVGRKDWVFFDRIFKRDFTVSVAAFILGALVLCGLHYYFSFTVYSQRTLPFLPFLGLLIVVLVNHINGALASQLRSYKKEPLVWVSLAGSALTVPVAFIAATNYSVGGVVLAILVVQLTITLPFSVHLWHKYNKKWRV